MKKSKTKQIRLAKPSLRAVILITWLVFLTGAAAMSLLWNWENMRAVNNAAVADWPRQVRSGMEDTYRYPVVSAQEKLFILPELNIALPYKDEFSGLRYSSHADDEYQEATLTTSDIIAASIQTKGAPDTTEFFEMPYFTCSLVLTIATQESEDFGSRLDSFELSDGRMIHAYAQGKNDELCDDVYIDHDVEDFLELVSLAKPYEL